MDKDKIWKEIYVEVNYPHLTPLAFEVEASIK